MSKKKNIPPQDKYSRHYHDTFMLLKSYRNARWNLEMAVHQVKNTFEIEYGSSIEDFLESIYLAGADLSGTDLENYAKSIERSNKMLKLLDSAIEVMRNNHPQGEQLYWLLYYTFLSPQKLENTNEILEKLNPHILSISERTYFRKRPYAIDTLSGILWGFSSKECLRILDKFVPEYM